MTEQHTIYLNGAQVKALLESGLLDGEKTISITMGDLLRGGEYAGWLMAEDITNFGKRADRLRIDMDRDGVVQYRNNEKVQS